jgi:dTDP-4-dehydrorhamnose 3,5-epimerase
MAKRILILGAGGQLGKALVARYPKATAYSRQDLDISDADAVEAIDWSSFDVVINAAAYVNADHSESDEARSMTWAANALGPRNLVKVCQEHDLHLIHFSSEYVFDGTKASHSEEESFSPLSVYGQTKAAADIVVGMLPKYHILRTTWVVGDGHNFVRTMMKLADLRIDPKVVDDQYGRLTFVSELVRAVEHILANDLKYGTYNLSNDGPINSWAEIARHVFEHIGHDVERVKKITTDEYKKDKALFAPRPTYSDLSLAKIQGTGFISEDHTTLLGDYIKQFPRNVE